MTQTNSKWLLRGSVAAVLGIAACFWPIIKVRAFNPQPDPPGFGLLGIVQGETMRSYAFCVDKTIDGFPPDPCDVQITYFDVSGNMLKTAEATIQPGSTGHLDLPSTAVKFPNGSKHVGIYTQVDFATGHIIPSVETFDASTGASHLFAHAAVPRLSLITGP